MNRGTIAGAYRRVVPKREDRRKSAALGIVLLVTALIGFIAHFVTVGSAYLLGVVAGSPYLMLASLLGALLLLLARRWLALVLAVVLVVLCASTQVRLYSSSDLPANAMNVRVMTSNLRLGGAKPSSLIDAVRRQRVDVLMLEELTVQEQSALIKAGLDKLLPYHASKPKFAATGTGLWSRYPLRAVTYRTDFAFNFVTARVAVPGIRVAPIAVALHMAGPYPDATAWNHDIAHLPAVLPTLAPGASALVGGDFNATPDTTQFRALLKNGFRDGAEQAGAGVTRTYPADKPFPPLLAIDHVLTRNAVAQSAATVQISGSDHRALVTTVAVPRG